MGKILMLFTILLILAGCTPDDVKSISVENIEMSRVADGKYNGKYETSLIKAEVEVQVIDHKIVDIKILKHENGLGKAAEKITEKVKEAQSLNVDSVAGATGSSKVILKAVETAVKKGIQE